MSVKPLITAEELWTMPEPSGGRRELVDGEIVEMSPATLLHGVIVGNAYEAIAAVVRQHDLGIVAAGDVGFVLRRDPDLVRAPDVAFVAWDRVPESGLPDRGFWEGPPTLAVEVVSPDDRAAEIHAKVRDYLEAGTGQVWVLWPEQRSVTVHEPDGSARDLGPDARLESTGVLPGFATPVETLFAVRRRRR